MKNDNLIYYDVVKSLKTTQDAEDFLSQIDNLLAKLFKINPDSLDKSLEKIVSFKFAELLRESFRKNNINQNDHSAIESFLNSIKDQVQKLNILKLQLTFNPTDETINSIFDWVAENYGNGIILDIQKDESILGGAIIAFNGKYKDLSLRKRFEDAFQKNRIDLKKTVAK